MKCNDCGFAARYMSPATLAKGSSVREPGEALCASCISKRNKMVRDLGLIPDRLDVIRSMRRPRTVRGMGVA